MQNGDEKLDYQAQWDRYWASIERTGMDGNVFWDVVPEQAAERDWAIFSKYLDPMLPLLDLGCGNGRQTRFLARLAATVIGVDLSPAAIARAKSETDVDCRNLEYRVYDALDTDQSRRLHAEFGDLNVYCRGVMHIIQPSDRPKFVASIEALLGVHGTLYQLDTHTSAPEYLRSLKGDHPSGLPKELFRVLSSDIHPIGFDAQNRASMYPADRWHILADSSDMTIDTIPLDHGQQARIPAYYVVLRRKAVSPESAAPLYSSAKISTR